MSSPCIHGFDPAACLICRTLTPEAQPATAAAAPGGRRHRQAGPTGSPASLSGPARPDQVYPPPSPGSPAPRSTWTRSLLLVLIALLALGAAVWILVGVVFTVLRLFELIIVAAGAGWVGYKIGHFRGSRHPRP